MDPPNQIMFGILGATLAVYVAQLTRATVTKLKSLTWGCELRWGSGLRMDGNVRVYMNRQHLKSLIHGVVVIANLGLLVGVWLMRNAWVGHGTLSAKAFFAVSYAVILACRSFQNRLTVPVVKGVYSLIMGLISAEILLSNTLATCNGQMLALFLRLYLSMWVMDCQLSGFWNIVIAVANGLVMGNASAIKDVAFTLLTIALVYEREQVAIADAVFAIREQNTQSERNVANALLNAMCDVVVPLDADLKITEHVPKLANMLLQRPSADCSIQGRGLHEFMPSDPDRDRFKAVITRMQKATAINKAMDSMAEKFYSQMVDSTGNVFEVEIFHAMTWELDNRLQHLIGIRELTDELNPRGLAQARARGVYGEGGEQGWMPPPRAAAAEMSAASLSAVAEEASDAGSVFAVFNALSPGMEFTYLSPGWVEAFGGECDASGADGSVEGWMDPRLVPEFRTWLQRHVNRMVNGEDDCSAQALPFGRVKSTDPRTGTRLKALLCVQFLDSEEGSMADTFPAKLLVLQVRASLSRSGSSLPRTCSRSLPTVAEEEV